MSPPSASPIASHAGFKFKCLAAALLNLGMLVPAGLAQDGRPNPEKPTSQADASGRAQNNQTAPAISTTPHTGNNGGPVATSPATGPGQRRVAKPGKVALAFNNVPLEEIIPFIVQSTGKVVMPVNLSTLNSHKITLINDEPIERSAALDLVIQALRENQVGVIETDEVIILDTIADIPKKPMPVLTDREDVMSRRDLGTSIVKIYRLKEASAENVGQQLQENLPDNAVLTIDANSNQLLLYGNVALAQHYQRLINELDHNRIEIKTETWRLRFADAQSVADNITTLFEESGAAAPQGNGPRPRGRTTPQGQRQPGQGTVQANPTGYQPGPVVELRVSVDTKQNSVTVVADPAKIAKIDELIRTQWDLATPPENAKVYVLKHTDPIKIRDLLQNMVGQGGGGRSSSAGGAGGRTGGQAGNGGRVQTPGGGGGGGGVSDTIGDIYRIEAYPDSNSVVVLSKTTAALDFLDRFIADLDQPSYIGVPVIVELKHANAINLAQELNVLLQETGSGQGLDKPGTGLSGQGPGSASSSNSGSSSSGADSGFSANLGSRGSGSGSSGGAGGTIQFPWQNGRARDDQTPESPLIGKVRIVPIVRQNALAILGPVASRQAVIELIEDFDKPGRQVMISAIIAEVQLNKDMALGLRLSSSPITSNLTDNSFAASGTIKATKNDLLGSIFDTSVLDLNVNVNALLQAINKKTNVRILQEPRIFTADNQEAIFFDGQEIPFISNSNTTSINGGLTQSFDYKKVGVILDVRPRITVNRDVDMEINLELSSVVPGDLILGGAVLDHRQTTTQIIVKNSQTIVLSGILKDTDSVTTWGVPLLSDIPWIGELFKSRETSKQTSEIVAFITPIVVDNPSENDDNFNRLERANLKELVRPLSEQMKDAAKIRAKIVTPQDAEGMPQPLATPDNANQAPPGGPALPKSEKSKRDSEKPESDPDKPPVDIDDPATEQLPE